MTPEQVVQKQRESLARVLAELAKYEPEKARRAQEEADGFFANELAKYPAELRLYCVREMSVAVSQYLAEHYGYEITYDDRWVGADGQLEQKAEMN